MLIIRGDEVSCGVDYVTLTQVTDGVKVSELEMLWIKMSGGMDVEKVRWAGYSGLQFGTVRLGSRERDGRTDHILTASGDCGLLTEIDVPLDVVRCTRIDLQVTVLLEIPNKDFARCYYDSLGESVSYRSSMIGRRSMSLVDSDTGQTLYIGKRSSRSMMLRLYDKSAAYQRRSGNIWRAEIEFKRDMAGSVASYVAKSRKSGLVVNEYLSSALEKYFGVVIPVDGNGNELGGRNETTPDTTAWVRKCVKPVFNRYYRAGREEEFLRALVGDRYYDKLFHVKQLP
jgi:hypothetical protein